MANVYDFLSPENKHKWEKELHSGLRKILKQVHPRLQIDEEATDFLELLVYQLLSQVCSSQPHCIGDIEEHVQASFAYPIDQWSLNEAHEKLEKHTLRKRNMSLFPVERIHHQLMKDVLGYKIDSVVIQFTMNVLDYVAADILKLAGNFVKNTRSPCMVINRRDIEVSLSADTSLQALFKQFHQSDLNLDVEINTDMSSMKYDELLRDLIDSETSFIRQLNILLKVFYPPFLSNPDVFRESDVDMIFGPVQVVYDLSVSLLASIEETMEMASEMSTQGTTYPQIGFSFEEITESGETSCYIDYTENYSDAQVMLEDMMNDPAIIQYLKEQTKLGNLPKLYIEAVKYVLPKALLEPIYHFFYYYAIMTAMSQVTDDDEDCTAFESAISVAIGEKSLVEKISQRFLPKKKEEAGLFGRRAGFKLSVKKLTDIQNKVEGWEGPDIHTHCTELIREGVLMVARDGGRKKQKVERYVFLLDGLVICCKTRKSGNTIVEYRMKEKLSIKRDMLLKDFSDDEMKFSFELTSPEHPSLIFFAKDRPEKNEWIAAFTVLLTRSAFERQLNLKLREEEKEIPTLVPDSRQYLYAEPDSDENILFEEEQRDNHFLIKAATIHKLIERLTYHEYADPTFVKTFLMTYRSFCKPGELLNYLIERYHIPAPVNRDSSDSRRDLQREAMKRYKANYVSPIQLRVLNVLRHWVENHYYDFEQDTAALDHLKEFVGTVKAKNVQKWVSSIHRALAKREAKSEQSVLSGTNPVFFQAPPMIEWHITRNKEEFNILTLHPVEFARQLTLILSELFRAIQSSELVDASWTKESKKEDASPNLLKMSRFETKLTNWIRHTIVFTENFEERVALCSRLIDIMTELKEMNNFAALFAINASFQCSQVFRLKATHKELTKKKQALDEFQQLCASDKGYRNYKERLRAINPPCVPFLGMYLTWIVFIRDGNDGRVKGKPEHFINFKKRRMIADILQEIQQYQNSRYCLKAEPMIQEYMKSHDVQGEVTHNQWEDMLYDQSLEIEPRDQPPKKSPREHKYDLRPPSSNPGTFAHILDATIRRPAKKQNPEEREEETTPIATPTNNTTVVEGTVSSPVIEQRKQDTSSPTGGTTEEPPPKPPPKLPPRPLIQHSAHLGSSFDLSSPGSPPPVPRSLSPKQDPHLTFHADGYGKPPPPLPPPPSYDDVIQETPPIIPRRPEHLSSPLDNKLQDESAPPIPPRPHSPLVINNDDIVPPPLPPPPQIQHSESPPIVPPPVVPRLPTGYASVVDNKVTEALESDLPPIVPPKPSYSAPVTPPTVPPPLVPRQRVTSEPINNEMGVAPPPIPPKPVR